MKKFCVVDVVCTHILTYSTDWPDTKDPAFQVIVNEKSPIY